ncbi:MAG: hypothetical protein ACPHQ8_10825, partial [Candidatus Puniceispirillaceae bacterium]
VAIIGGFLRLGQFDWPGVDWHDGRHSELSFVWPESASPARPVQSLSVQRLCASLSPSPLLVVRNFD